MESNSKSGKKMGRPKKYEGDGEGAPYFGVRLNPPVYNHIKKQPKPRDYIERLVTEDAERTGEPLEFPFYLGLAYKKLKRCTGTTEAGTIAEFIKENPGRVEIFCQGENGRPDSYRIWVGNSETDRGELRVVWPDGSTVTSPTLQGPEDGNHDIGHG